MWPWKCFPGLDVGILGIEITSSRPNLACRKYKAMTFGKNLRILSRQEKQPTEKNINIRVYHLVLWRTFNSSTPLQYPKVSGIPWHTWINKPRVWSGGTVYFLSAECFQAGVPSDGSAGFGMRVLKLGSGFSLHSYAAQHLLWAHRYKHDHMSLIHRAPWCHLH